MLQNKNFTKLLSVALAVFLWVYVITVENPPTKAKLSNIPIQMVNIESLNQRGLAINADENTSIDIVIEGKRADVLKISANDIVATVDVFGYGIGENYIPVTVTVPDTVRIADQRTNKMIINIEELVSVYKPINVIFSGTSSTDNEATVFDITPVEVEVKGAKSKVASVSSVNATIEIAKLTSTPQVFATDLLIVDAKGQNVNNVKLSADTADIKAALYQLKELPLNLAITGEIDKKYQVTEMKVPETVMVKGLKADLEGLTSITAAGIDLSSVSATTEIPIKIDLPKGIILANDSTGTVVSISIKGISIKEFDIESSKIVATGLGENLSLVINTQSVKVNVSGNESDIDSMTAEDVALAVDLTGLEAGMHIVPIKIEKDDKISEMIVTPSEIHITINEAV